MRSPPKAILLDLDDTILDDSSGVEHHWRTVCVDAARGVPQLDAERLFAEITRVRDWYWSDPERARVARQDLRTTSTGIVHRALTSLGHDDLVLARAIAHAYRDTCEAAFAPFPGAIQTLAKLRTRDLHLALVTNGAGPAQRAKIDRFDLARYFTTIVIEGEVGIGKPDEHVYRLAMEILRVRPQETWMVGDNFENEVVAPSYLGLGTVWVDRKSVGLAPGCLARPDHIITSLDQLPHLLDR